jgi:hypothetical protein
MPEFYPNCSDPRKQFWWQHFVFMITGVGLALCSNYLGNNGIDDEFSGLLLLPNYAGEILAFPYLFVPYDGPRWEWRFALISTLDLAVRARAPAPTFMPAHAIPAASISSSHVYGCGWR